MANHGAILVWSSVLAGAQLRRDVIWYYWVVFTYKGMTSLTTYMMSWIVRFEDILNYFENESRSVLIGFGRCEIFSLEDVLEETEKLTTVFPWELTKDYSVRDALIVISAVFAPFLHLCAVRWFRFCSALRIRNRRNLFQRVKVTGTNFV